MSFGAVIFDFDGTLAETMPAILDATRRTFEEAGLPAPEPERVREAMADGRGLDHALMALNPAITPEDSVAWVRRWRGVYNDSSYILARPYEGALRVLRTLSESGVRLAVVSNKGSAALVEAVRRMGMAPYLHCVAGEESGKPRKPDPAVFYDRILREVPGVDASTTLVVGDCESDLRFARAIRSRFCFAAYGYGDRLRMRGLLPDLVINRLTDLAALPELFP